MATSSDPRIAGLIGGRWGRPRWTLGRSFSFERVFGDCLHAPFEQGLLGVRRGGRKSSLRVRERSIAIPTSPMQLSERGIPKVEAKAPARRLKRLERGEPRVGSLPLGQRDGTIQDVEWRRSDALEHLVEPNDLPPVRFGIRRRQPGLRRYARLRVITRHPLAASG